MGLLEWIFGSNVRYRFRIFDGYTHILTKNVKAKGQNFEIIGVYVPLLGKAVRMAYMIPDDIKPFVFDGKTFELNYDIRDACPMADMMDVYPKLVQEIDQDVYTLLQQMKNKRQNRHANAEETVIDADFIEQFTEPKDQKAKADPIKDGVKEALKEEETESRIEVFKRKSEEVREKGAEVVKDSVHILHELTRLHFMDLPDERKKKIQDVLDFSAKYPHLYTYLARKLGVSEVTAIVNAKRIIRMGVMAEYYIAQTNAPIAEKMMTKPAEKKDLYDFLIILAVVFGFVASILIIALLVTGKI